MKTHPHQNLSKTPVTPQESTGLWLVKLLIVLVVAIEVTAVALLWYGSRS